jgi:putative oxidoreductase
MSSHIVALDIGKPHTAAAPVVRDSRAVLALAGRVLFGLIFLMAPLTHFAPQTIAYAAQAGVPFASILVPASGVLALAGGLSVLLGYHAKVGAWLLVAFLVPVTLAMHNFWVVRDPMLAQLQMAMFFKNVSMLGGALLIAYHGAGPLSLDARRSLRA